MIVGVSGARTGMNSLQELNIMQLFNAHSDITELHHGDCLGVDATAHELALSFGFDIVIHPPRVSVLRAYCAGAKEIRPELDYLDRNKNIVDESDLLFAVPKEEQEQFRSGTWSTVRYAKKRGVPIYLCLPSGKVEVLT